MMRDVLSGDRPHRIGVRPARYRAMLLGGSGQIASLIRLDAINDNEAMSLAEAMVDIHAIELWDGLRFIEHFPVLNGDHPISD